MFCLNSLRRLLHVGLSLIFKWRALALAPILNLKCLSNLPHKCSISLTLPRGKNILLIMLINVRNFFKQGKIIPQI